MKEKIMKVLTGLRPEIDFEKEDKLITAGVLDSFDIVYLIGEINDMFDIAVDFEDMTPDNFDSVDAMAKLVLRLQEEE